MQLQGGTTIQTMSPLSLLLLVFFFTVTSESLPFFFPSPASQSYPFLRQAHHHTHKKSSKPGLPFETRYFPQIIDHFSFQPGSYKTFNQKYLINGENWQSGGPIFVYTGNEGNIEWFAANTGFLVDITPKFRALLVFIEHRYYGESMPFGKKGSYKSAEELGYLNSQQALADYAVLIRSLKRNLSADASPVVVFGGSYGGMLAAWFRLKYPHITIGALASSAPILQFDNIVPWSSFYDAVSEDYKAVSLNCYEVIKGSWEELLEFGNESPESGLAELSRIFRSCKELQSVDPAWDWLWTAFTYTAMVNYPTEADFVMHLPAYPVTEMCKIIDTFPPGATKLSRAFAAASLYYNYSGTEKCFNLEDQHDSHGANRGWGWQACTEMVMPMSCSNESMFLPSSYNYKEFAAYCSGKYGVAPRPHWITTEFGGERIDKVLKRFGSNIIFSNGMQDPWSRGSVLKNISDIIVALVTEKGAHHADFRSATKDDPDWLIEQRRQEVEIIRTWIDQYYADLKDK